LVSFYQSVWRSSAYRPHRAAGSAPLAGARLQRDAGASENRKPNWVYRLGFLLFSPSISWACSLRRRRPWARRCGFCPRGKVFPWASASSGHRCRCSGTRCSLALVGVLLQQARCEWSPAGKNGLGFFYKHVSYFGIALRSSASSLSERFSFSDLS